MVPDHSVRSPDWQVGAGGGAASVSPESAFPSSWPESVRRESVELSRGLDPASVEPASVEPPLATPWKCPSLDEHAAAIHAKAQVARHASSGRDFKEDSMRPSQQQR